MCLWGFTCRQQYSLATTSLLGTVGLIQSWSFYYELCVLCLEKGGGERGKRNKTKYIMTISVHKILNWDLKYCVL